MRSHLDALQAMHPVNFRRAPRDSHSVAKQAAFYIALGAHFQGFWKAKWLPKFGFRGFFLTLFFIAFEHPIVVDFSRLRTRKIVIPLRENNDFRKNCVFGKSALVARFCLRFLRPKWRKSIQNSNPKTCCFESWNLKGFSSNFRCILESKNHQKIANIRKKWCSRASSVALSL